MADILPTVTLCDDKDEVYVIINESDYTKDKEGWTHGGKYHVKGEVPDEPEQKQEEPVDEDPVEDVADEDSGDFLSFAEAEDLSFLELREYASQYGVNGRSKEGLLDELKEKNLLS